MTNSNHWGLWGTIVWGVLIALVFIVLQTAILFSMAILDTASGSDADLERQMLEAADDGTLLAWATIVTAVVCPLLIAGIIKLKRGSQLRGYLALQPVPRATFLKWLGIFAGFLLLSDVVTTLVGRSIVPDFMLNTYRTAQPVWLLWIALVVGAPLFEELFFRGFLFKGLESSRLGTVGAILITAALWALIHDQYEAYEISVIFVFGLLLGFARARTGSVLVPIAAHALANLVATIETSIVAT